MLGRYRTSPKDSFSIVSVADVPAIRYHKPMACDQRCEMHDGPVLGVYPATRRHPGKTHACDKLRFSILADIANSSGHVPWIPSPKTPHQWPLRSWDMPNSFLPIYAEVPYPTTAPAKLGTDMFRRRKGEMKERVEKKEEEKKKKKKRITSSSRHTGYAHATETGRGDTAWVSAAFSGFDCRLGFLMGGNKASTSSSEGKAPGAAG